MDLIFQLPLVPQLQDLLLLFFLQPRSSCRITAAATLFTLFFLSTTSSYAQQQTSSSSCSQTWIRREIRELIDTATTNQLLPDGQAFFDGVKCLMRLPGISGSGSVSVWDDFTLTHLNNVATAHGVAAFLPWHRAFLIAMENAMRNCTGNNNIYIPYWDGSMDSQSPETSPLWRYIGGNGQGSCIPNGPFAGIRAAYSTPHCVSRDFQKGSLPSEEVVAGTYLTQPTYAGFRPALETGYHTSVHVWVGGDFPVMYSSNDPLFYLHHSNVDRIWTQWQKLNPSVAHSYSGPTASASMGASATDIMNFNFIGRYLPGATGGKLPVSSLLGDSLTDWCYSYSNGVTAVTTTTTSTTTTKGSTTATTTATTTTSAATTNLSITTTASAPSSGPTDAIQLVGNTSSSTHQQPPGVVSAAIPRWAGRGGSGGGHWYYVWTDLKRLVKRAIGVNLLATTTEEDSKMRIILHRRDNANNDVVNNHHNNNEDAVSHHHHHHGSPFNKITPPSTDRLDYYNIRMYDPIPLHSIRMMGYNETRVRQREDIAAQFIRHINQVDGYVSPCAIVRNGMKRDDDEKEEGSGGSVGYRELTDEEMEAKWARHRVLWDSAKKALGLDLI